MNNKYAPEHQNDSEWPYWIIERNISLSVVPPIWRHERTIGIEEPICVVKSPLYRTVAVTEEYYKLIAVEGERYDP